VEHGYGFISHAPALVKKNVNMILTVIPDPTTNGHVGIDVYGECRDGFDHRKDRSIAPVDVRTEIQSR
jgi:hypothetical protein